MPDTPVAEITFEEPVSSFPLRQGEEKHAATLELDQAMRHDSEIESLKAQVAALTGQASPMKKMKEGPGAVKRRQILQEKSKELFAITRKEGDRWTGPCTPFTVVNFNPERLSLQGELQDQFVPASDHQYAKKMRFPFNGRTFEGAFVTFVNPKVWPVIIGTENINGEDVPSIRADYLTPMGIAHQFFEHYTVGAVDALGMGGIIMFEGDARTLSRPRLDRMGGKILVPIQDTVNSTPARPVYKVEEFLLVDILQKALLQQRRYAEAVIAEGHAFYHSANPEEQKQLTQRHVKWHNWAIERGYKDEPEEWASERLVASPDVKAVTCPGCGAKQPKGNPHFCQTCNAPFDAFRSFMAGMPVPEVWLTGYEGEQWEAIVKETKRRNSKAEMLAPKDKKEKKGEKAE